MMTLATGCGLAAIQLRGVDAVVPTYLLLTMAPMVVALVADKLAEQAHYPDFISVPGLSIQRWMGGPAAVVWLPLLLPVGACIEVVNCFRVRIPPELREPAPGRMPTGAVHS